jgi:ABC-type bacteriocin/lantibiotic exporter with double-glycine peptidase domain
VRRATGRLEHGFRRASYPLLVPLAVLFLSWLQVLTGCTAGPGTGAPDSPTAIGSGKVERVPFYPQLSYQCGPACLAGVLNFYGDGVTPNEIGEAIFRKHIRGTVTLDMVLYARNRGFSARWYSGSVDDIRRSVDQGVPLIVMVDLGFANVSNNHYMVVVGYRPEGVIAHSAKTPEELITWKHFLTRWDRTQRWTLRIEPGISPQSERAPNRR